MDPAKKYAESVAHTSLGLRLWRNPREAPTRNSTLKACHIADTKGGFNCKATETGQLSIGDRLRCNSPSLRRRRRTTLIFPLFPDSQLASQPGACNVLSAFSKASSGRSAAWFSAFDWGSKGREFESLRPDHFKACNSLSCRLFSFPFSCMRLKVDACLGLLCRTLAACPSTLSTMSTENTVNACESGLHLSRPDI